jgi:hypothetical protein
VFNQHLCEIDDACLVPDRQQCPLHGYTYGEWRDISGAVRRNPPRFLSRGERHILRGSRYRRENTG